MKHFRFSLTAVALSFAMVLSSGLFSTARADFTPSLCDIQSIGEDGGTDVTEALRRYNAFSKTNQNACRLAIILNKPGVISMPNGITITRTIPGDTERGSSIRRCISRIDPATQRPYDQFCEIDPAAGQTATIDVSGFRNPDGSARCPIVVHRGANFYFINIRILAADPATAICDENGIPIIRTDLGADSPFVDVTRATVGQGAVPVAGYNPSGVQDGGRILELCNTDTDRDGVVDCLDRCADTPAGFSVNRKGCSLLTPDPNGVACFYPGAFEDDDGDGYVNCYDFCPATPAGTRVDSNGCPVGTTVDTDRDGVPDTRDRCPNTSPKTAVDENGCSADQRNTDTDGDGVPDTRDRCPNTPTGTAVDANGCSMTQREADTDGDGITDALDLCPRLNASATCAAVIAGTFRGTGVALPNCSQTEDYDGDGRGNYCDADGDIDGDGVMDEVDPNPNTPDADGDAFCDGTRDVTRAGVTVCRSGDQCPLNNAFYRRNTAGECADEGTGPGTSAPQCSFTINADSTHVQLNWTCTGQAPTTPYTLTRTNGAVNTPLVLTSPTATSYSEALPGADVRYTLVVTGPTGATSTYVAYYDQNNVGGVTNGPTCAITMSLRSDQLVINWVVNGDLADNPITLTRTLVGGSQIVLQDVAATVREYIQAIPTDDAGFVLRVAGRNGTSSSCVGFYDRNNINTDVNPTPTDTDGDGVPNTDDNCPLISNGPLTPGIITEDIQLDSNRNGYGDPCDPLANIHVEGGGCSLVKDAPMAMNAQALAVMVLFSVSFMMGLRLRKQN